MRIETGQCKCHVICVRIVLKLIFTICNLFTKKSILFLSRATAQTEVHPTLCGLTTTVSFRIVLVPNINTMHLFIYNFNLFIHLYSFELVLRLRRLLTLTHSLPILLVTC